MKIQSPFGPKLAVIKIPKKIYQTWKTQNLPKKILKMHSNMLTQNPDFEHIIYTDEQMNDYMTSNAEKEILLLVLLYWLQLYVHLRCMVV